MSRTVFRLGLIALTLLALVCTVLAVAQVIPAWVGWVLFAGFLAWSALYYGAKRSSRAK